LQIAKADAALFRLPAFIENRRADVGHARRVGIHLRGHVQPTAPRARDHLQAQRCLPQTHAGDVDYVQCRARGGRVGDHLLHPIDHARLDRPSIPYVNVDRGLPLGRQPEQFQNLGASCQRHISDPHADAQRAIVQALAYQFVDLAALLRRGGAFGGIVRQQRAAIVHYRHARRNVPGCGAEVDQRLPFPGAIPLRHRRNTHLHFERGGYAIPGFEAVVLRRLPMRVQIDEARRHHQSGNIQHRSAWQRRLGNRRDLRAANPDVAHRIQAGSRVQHPAIRQDHIVLLPKSGRRHEHDRHDATCHSVS